ncbi:hypothetical protein V6N12_065295 [Hibiscus sabdariffa]|uniref:Uncharacterized protein n=1 Tax=Hibiscus sabdariffa TaxID=183260 RepID=A0ABR2G8A6_9ROSI
MSNPYAQFSWTITFGTEIVQQTPPQSLLYLNGPSGTSGTAGVGKRDGDDDDDDVDCVSVDVIQVHRNLDRPRRPPRC